MEGRANGAAPPPPPPRRRWRRRIVVAAGVCAVGFALVVGFLPAILSTSAGKAVLLSFAEKRLAAEVEVDTLALSWGSEQRLEGLRVGPPAGYTADEDTLRARTVTVGSSLLGLLFASDAPLWIEVDGLVLRLERRDDGRWNVQDLARRPEESPHREGGAADSDGESSQGEGKRETTRPLQVRVRDSEVLLADHRSGVEAKLVGVAFEGDLSADRARLSASGRPQPASGAQERPGAFELSADVRGLAAARSVGDLQVEGDIDLRDVDPGPYRPLIEEWARIRVPQGPLEAHMRVEAREGVATVVWDLDSGVAKTREGKASVRLGRDRGRPSSVTVPFEARVEGLLEMLSPRLELPEGALVAGTAKGQLEVRGALFARGAEVGGDESLEVALSLALDDVRARWPRAVAGPTAAAVDPPLEPVLDVAGERATVELRAAVHAGLDTVRIEDLVFRTRGVDARISGTIRRRVQSGSERKEAADASPSVAIDLRSDVRVVLQELRSRIDTSVPRELELGAESSLEIQELALLGVVGRGDGSPGLLESVSATGKLRVEGGARYRGLSVDALSASLVVEQGEVSLSGVEATLNGGRLARGDLRVGLVSEPRPFELAVEVEHVAANVRLAPLLAYVAPVLSLRDRQADLQGRIAASVRLSGRGFRFEELREHLRGEGRLDIGEGQVVGSRFLEELAKLLGGDLERLRFSRVASEFSIGGRGVELKETLLVVREGTKVRNLGLRGTVNLDRRLDLFVDLEAVKETIGDDKIRRILEGVRDVLGKVTVPLRVGGTLEDPRLSIDPEALVPEKLDLERVLDDLLRGR